MRSFAPRGMTLVDVIVGIGLFLVVFVGLFGILRASLQISGLAKVKAIATTVATSQMEYIRSLPYEQMGTLGGIPAGTIPQYASSTNGGLRFDVRTYIEYADDPADGAGAADTNGITTDYKHLKVIASYTVNGITRDVTLVSNAAPEGIESTTGGGTILITVVDAVGVAVPGATVRIRNASTSPTIDVSTFSDSTGMVNLPGAPASTNYKIDVSKTAHSSAQTYDRNAANPNPSPGHLTVVAGSTTTGTFSIDDLAQLVIRTFSPIQTNAFSDTFTDSAGITASSNTTVSGGQLLLSGAPGSYPSAGESTATTTRPTYLAAWKTADASLSTPVGTSVRFQVTDSSGTVLPDAVLAGNSTGFTGLVNLDGVSTTTYPALALRALLTSTDVLQTPAITDWTIGYDEGPLPLPDVPFTLTGAKTIGSTALGAPIYKTTVATTTGSDGTRTLTLEWDLYNITLTGYTVVSEDPEAPYELLPGTTATGTMILTP